AHFVHGGEHLFAAGIVHDAQYGGVVFERGVVIDAGAAMRNKGDRHGIVGYTVQEIGGAVERVDIPGGSALGLAAAFFDHNTQFRAAFVQNIENGLFGFAVGLRHEVVAGFGVDGQFVAVGSV